MQNTPPIGGLATAEKTSTSEKRDYSASGTVRPPLLRDCSCARDLTVHVPVTSQCSHDRTCSTLLHLIKLSSASSTLL
jgi:hypothetical protein